MYASLVNSVLPWLNNKFNNNNNNVDMQLATEPWNVTFHGAATTYNDIFMNSLYIWEMRNTGKSDTEKMDALSNERLSEANESPTSPIVY